MDGTKRNRYSILTLFGTAFLIIGSGLLMLSHYFETDDGSSNSLKSQKSHLHFLTIYYCGKLSQIVKKSIYLLKSVMGISILTNIVFLLMLIYSINKVPNMITRTLITLDYIPAGRFSPQLTSSIQYALIGGIFGNIIHSVAKNTQNYFKETSSGSQVDKIAVHVSDLITIVSFSLLSLILVVLIMEEAYGLPLYIRRPNLVNLPQEWNVWVPNRSQAANLIGGVLGAALSVLYIRLYLKIPTSK